jgi:hypothetical protein
MNRRTFSKLVGSGLLLPHFVHAQEASERNFLFVFADGGWDPCTVFAPLFDNPHVDMLPDSDRMEIHGLQLVDSPMRPSVRSFFSRYGADTVVFNGLDLETVSHERGKQIIMTGSTQGLDDWGAHLAHASASRNSHLIVSGPSFVTDFPDAIVRVGKRGQLRNLLMADDEASQQINRLGEEHVERYLLSQAEKHVQRFSDPFAQRFAQTHLKALQQQTRIMQEGPNINFDIDTNNLYGNCEDSFMMDLEVALSAMEVGLIRSAIVEDYGYCGWRWDTHYDLVEQSYHFELLFSGLNNLMEQLELRRDPSGVRLIDKTTVVVLSEMGRHPKLNYIGGKDHWPVTSMMMVGGVKGGRTIGAFSEQVISSPIDPSSGALFSGGEKLRAEHIGATLLALADIDPSSLLDASPILDILP